VGAADRRIGSIRLLSVAVRNCRQNGKLPLVVDIKLVSPRDGELLKDRQPAELARLAEQAGACAVSVVTESDHFGGSVAVLREVARACSLPVLQKDFFTSPAQVAEGYRAGASAILIIMANTSDAVALQLHQKAARLEMEAVVEVHTRAELQRALRLGPTLIGINNRDILRLEMDAGGVATTERLAPAVPREILILSESSLRSNADIHRAFAAGADAVLVGTAILQADDFQARLIQLMGAGEPAAGASSR